MEGSCLKNEPAARGEPRVITIVTTAGETLPDGNSINLFRLENGKLGVIVSKMTSGIAGDSVVHGGCRYFPVPLRRAYSVN